MSTARAGAAADGVAAAASAGDDDVVAGGGTSNAVQWWLGDARVPRTVRAVAVRPSAQVRPTSFGVTVNVQHLTPAGAARIPACVQRNAAARVHHELRLQVGASHACLYTVEPGVSPAMDVSFGPLTAVAGLGPDPEIGFVDLTRTTLAEATRYAVAGLAPARARDGLLVVVTADRVHLLPLPVEPADLAGHVEAELATPPRRPTVEVLHRLCRPQWSAGRRVSAVRAPSALVEAAVLQWGGEPLLQAVLAAQHAHALWAQTFDVAGRAATAAVSVVAQVGLVRLLGGAVEDEVLIESVKGPGRACDQWVEGVHVLAATPWTGPADEVACWTYHQLRAGGLSVADALTVLPELL